MFDFKTNALEKFTTLNTLVSIVNSMILISVSLTNTFNFHPYLDYMYISIVVFTYLELYTNIKIFQVSSCSIYVNKLLKNENTHKYRNDYGVLKNLYKVYKNPFIGSFSLIIDIASILLLVYVIAVEEQTRHLWIPIGIQLIYSIMYPISLNKYNK